MRRRALRHAPPAPPVPAGDRGQRPGLAHLERPPRTAARRITGYSVYRGDQPRARRVALSSPIPAWCTSYTRHAAPRTGTIYYYKVTALNAIGESVASNEANATPVAPATRPQRPQSLQATAGNAQVSLAWTRTLLERRLGLTGYSVYRGTSPGPDASPSLPPRRGDELHSTPGRRTGTTYYYKVTALNAIGESSPRTRRMRRPALRQRAPSAPQSLQATAATPRSRSPGRAPSSDGGSAITGLQRVPRQPAPDPSRRPHSPISAWCTSYTRHARATNGHHLLLQGHRLERDRRERRLERGECDAERSDPPTRGAVARRRQLQQERESAFGRRSLVERHHRRGRDRAPHHIQPARVHANDDVYSLAQQRPVRPRRRVLGPHHDAYREPATPSCSTFA